MKKTVIGVFLSIIGTIWIMGVIVLAGSELTGAWSTPPGRIVTTISELNMITPMIIGVIFLVFGLVIMGVEYFKTDD